MNLRNNGSAETAPHGARWGYVMERTSSTDRACERCGPSRIDPEHPESSSNIWRFCPAHRERPAKIWRQLAPGWFVGRRVKARFALRAPDPDGTVAECMWLIVDRVDGGGVLHGRLRNHPVGDVGLTYGAAVRVPRRCVLDVAAEGAC
jgi:hypothetical protein